MPGASVNPIIDYLVQSRDAVQAAIDDPAFTGVIRDIVEVAANALRDGGKLLLAGNGGSAGDAQHLAGEMLSRLYYDRAPCAAIAGERRAVIGSFDSFNPFIVKGQPAAGAI